MSTKLNIGCGKDIRKGWINLDIVPLDGVDIVHDILDIPLPFKENSFDYILDKHVFEHIPPLHAKTRRDGFLVLVEELHRILNKEGVLEAIFPYWKAREAFIDPMHYRILFPESFNGFLYDKCTTSDIGYHTKVRFKMIEKKLKRRLRFGKYFDSRYHIPKYLKFHINIGFGVEWMVKLKKQKLSESKDGILEKYLYIFKIVR